MGVDKPRDLLFTLPHSGIDRAVRGSIRDVVAPATVTVEVEVHGSEVVCHFVDGKQVIEYFQPQLDARDPDAKKFIVDGKLLLDRGTISLQSESAPIEFRKIELLKLN